jgi:hypothetical protein
MVVVLSYPSSAAAVRRLCGSGFITSRVGYCRWLRSSGFLLYRASAAAVRGLRGISSITSRIGCCFWLRGSSLLYRLSAAAVGCVIAVVFYRASAAVGFVVVFEYIAHRLLPLVAW